MTVRGEGRAQDFKRQAASKFATSYPAFRVLARVGAPRHEGSVLLWCSLLIAGDVTVWQAFDELRERRRTFDATALVTIAEHKGMKFQAKAANRFPVVCGRLLRRSHSTQNNGAAGKSKVRSVTGK